MLSTLRQLGATPDFGILHRYAEYPPSIPENDQYLLQFGTNWAGYAAGLRQQITQYFGSGGSNIELLETENNANATLPQGKQSVSLVNGLYYADSLGQLIKTELNALVWWQLRDGVWNHDRHYGKKSQPIRRPGKHALWLTKHPYQRRRTIQTRCFGDKSKFLAMITLD